MNNIQAIEIVILNLVQGLIMSQISKRVRNGARGDYYFNRLIN